MAVWFTSDLHLGHRFIAKTRNFASIEEHDDTILHNLSKKVTKHDKLFILGDVAFRREDLFKLQELHCAKELIIGNHDLIQMSDFQKVFTKIHGFRGYRNWWLSHCPIHPQEMIGVKGNIHGHIHTSGITENLPLPYVNVNTDANNFEPLNFEYIDSLVNVIIPIPKREDNEIQFSNY